MVSLIYIFHPWHVWHCFLSFPNTFPKLDKVFHFWHLSFMCPLFFQRSEESFLVSLEYDIVQLSSPFFFLFCQLCLFLPQLVHPLLLCISQVVISCIFLSHDSQFLNDLLFLLGCFSLLPPSVQLVACFHYDLT